MPISAWVCTYIYYTRISVPEIYRTTRGRGGIEGIVIVKDRTMVE